jgi:hypothetical protein
MNDLKDQNANTVKTQTGGYEETPQTTNESYGQTEPAQKSQSALRGTEPCPDGMIRDANGNCVDSPNK